MLPVRRLRPPVRLGPRRRRHQSRRRPHPRLLAAVRLRPAARRPALPAVVVTAAAALSLVSSAAVVSAAPGAVAPAAAPGVRTPAAIVSAAPAAVAGAAVPVVRTPAAAFITARPGSPGRPAPETPLRLRSPAVVPLAAPVPAPAVTPVVGRPVGHVGSGGNVVPAWQQAPPVSYMPPVDAPIADPFRPPAGPYGAGNRGLEYATAPATPVRAAADGTVTFAGQVGGRLHVTLLHADGVRTSYSFLVTIEVVLGATVRRGDRLGTSGTRLHFGARSGDAYFDPAALFTGTVTEVELLPFEIPPGSSPGAEARALAGLALAAGGGGLPLPELADTFEWLRAHARTGLDRARELSPVAIGLTMAGELTGRLLDPRPCSPSPPPARPAAADPHRVAVTVAGLGSTSTSGSIDELRVDELGYRPDRVVRFSYAGGRTPATGGDFAGIDATDYESADTQGDIAVAGARLADLVEQVAAADPAAVVDVHAHSLGGLVARVAVVQLRDRGFDLSRLGVVTTLGTPHDGADAATAVATANTRLVPNLALDAAEAVLDTGLDPDAPVVGQLAERSDLVTSLAAAGVPGGVRLLSVAARGDVVVAAPRTDVRGAANVTVPVGGWSAHGDLVGSAAATGEIARALAGEPPGCEPWYDVLGDVVTGHAVAAVEDHLGAAAMVAGG